MQDKRIAYSVATQTVSDGTSTATPKMEIEVLAWSRDQAERAVKDRYPNTEIIGSMSESEILHDYELAKAAKAGGKDGYVVSGYIGNSLSPSTAKKLVVPASSVEDAMFAAMDQDHQFRPLTAANSARYRELLDLFQQLRLDFPLPT